MPASVDVDSMSRVMNWLSRLFAGRVDQAAHVRLAHTKRAQSVLPCAFGFALLVHGSIQARMRVIG